MMVGRGVYPTLIRGGAVVGVALVILILRRPETLTVAEFWSDESQLYAHALRWGASTTLWSWNGVLLIVPRLAAQLETAVPPVYAPLLGNAIALVLTALVAAFLASDRMADLIPDRRGRLALALVFVLLPASQEMLGTMTDVQWVLAVWMLAMLVATPSPTVAGRVADAGGLFITGLTGPAGLVLWPLFAWRAVRSARWRTPVIALTTANVLQVWALGAGGRVTPAGVDWGIVPEVLVTRLTMTITGVAGPHPGALLTIVVVAAVALAIRGLPRWWIPAIGLAIAFPLSGLVSTNTPTATLLEAPIAARYFYLTGAIAVALIVASAARGHRAAIPALALLAIGVVVDFRIPPVPPAGWADRAGCIGGPVACSVPVPGSGSLVWYVEYVPGTSERLPDGR